MGQGNTHAFRAQLFLKEQQQLFDYWQSHRRGADFPSRECLTPSGLASLLPHVSLIELLPDPDVMRVRLAGSALWDIHGREITGKTLANDDWGGNREYWKRNYTLLRAEPEPATGILRAPAAGKDHMVQYWLRLPVSNGDGIILLGLDICVAASKMDTGLLSGQDGMSLAASGQG